MTADPGAMDQEPQSAGRRAIAPLLVLGVLVILVIAVLVLANQAGDTGLPPQPDEFATPAPVEAFAASSVRQVANGDITFGDEGFAIPDGASIELLRPTGFDAISEGDHVTAVGIDNQVRSFVVRYIVVFPGDPERDPGDFYRSPGGFRGHEPGSGGNERPLFSGEVTAVEDGVITLDREGGEIRLELTGEFPPPPGMIRVFEEGSRDDITAGSRVALPAEDGAPASDAEAAIVLLPGE